MIRQVFHIKSYWKAIVYYDVDYSLFDMVAEDFFRYGAGEGVIYGIYGEMHSGRAVAVTWSSLGRHRSIILFNRHRSRKDYLNSIIHEAEHMKQHMLQAYNVDDDGEPPAYTIGYIAEKMYKVFRFLI